MGIVNYIKDSFSELKNNVTWMPWQEAQQTTVVVAVFTVVFAIAVFFVDKFFQLVLDQYFNLFN